MTTARLEKLEKQRDQLNAKIQDAKNRERAKARKMETQAKILLGSALLNRVNSGDEKGAELLAWCRSALTEKDQLRLHACLDSIDKKKAAQ